MLRRVVADPVTNAVSEDVVFGYDGSSDSPAYPRPTAGGALTTYVSGPGLSAIDVGGTITYELANAHGDVIGTADAVGTFTAYPDTDEFGVGPTPATRRGWLGAKDRFSTGGGLGLIRMGVRLYEPRLGRFLSVDPVKGGSANDYDYVGGDPINQFDLDGTICWRCAARKVKKIAKRVMRNPAFQIGVTSVACGFGTQRLVRPRTLDSPRTTPLTECFRRASTDVPPSPVRSTSGLPSRASRR